MKRWLYSLLIFALCACGMPHYVQADRGSLFQYPLFEAYDSNGDPCSGCSLYTYQAGTTTARTVYKERALTTAHTNPIVLNSSGRPPSDVGIWGAGLFKFVLKDSSGVTMWTLDNIEAVGEYSIDYYFPDYSAADQGATGGGNTIKAYIDTIGSTNAVIYCRNNSGSATTAYTFDTSESAGSNIFFEFEPGAYLDQVTGDEVVTIYSLDNIISFKNTKIFDGDMIDVSVGGTADPRMWGANLDGTTNDNAAIGACFASLVSKSRVVFNGMGLVTAQVNIAANQDEITLDGLGYGGLKLDTNKSVDAGSNWAWIKILGDNCLLTGMVFDGNGTNQTYLFNLVQLSEQSNAAYYADGTRVTDCIFKNGYGTGIVPGCARDIKIKGNKFLSITGAAGNPGEGISAVYTEGLSVVNNSFRTLDDHGVYLGVGVRDVTITGNNFYECKGLGVNIYGDVLRATVDSNTMNYCRGGVYVHNNGASIPNNIAINNNVIYQCHDHIASGISHGILFSPGTSQQKKNYSATGNIIDLTGNGADILSMGIIADYVNGLVLADNIVSNSSRHGIFLRDCINFLLSHNKCYNNGAQTAGYAGISLEKFPSVGSGCTYGNIIGNICYDDGNVQDYGIYLDGNSDYIKIFNNDCRGNDVADFNVNGTNNKIRDNVGYVSENSGTSAAIATGGTIAHGLAAAPAYVSVTPAEAGPTDVTATSDATNITVTFGGGGNKTFYWSSRIAQSK